MECALISIHRMSAYFPMADHVGMKTFDSVDWKLLIRVPTRQLAHRVIR